MKSYALMDETNTYPIMITNGLRVPPGAVEIENILPQDIVDAMLVDGIFVKRPRLGSPSMEVVNGSCNISLQVPAQTLAEIYDKFTTELLGQVSESLGEIRFELVDPAAYQIVVKPPKPYMELSFEVAFDDSNST